MKIINSSKPEFDSYQENFENDPEYQKLLAHYQNANFSECSEMLEILLIKYPDHPDLRKFEEDLQLRLSLKKMASSSKKGNIRKQTKVTLNMAIFGIAATLVVLIAFYISNNFLIGDVTVEENQQQSTQLSSFNEQAEQLLLIGKPQDAAAIIDKMNSIDPEYETLPDLTSRTGDLLALEEKYSEAIKLIDNNMGQEAIAILKEIDSKRPGLWDVKQRIESIETSTLLNKYLEEGNTAYQAQLWDEVITAYESALQLDPNFNDPIMKEQLLKGYLNKIITMLETGDSSFENIAKAEEYYRKAAVMIPQNKQFESERGNLNEISGNLLVMKYSQLLKDTLADKNQTTTSIETAVAYMNKAVSIYPNNTVIQADLKNAQYYQNGFQNFVDMDWEGAIKNFSKITAVDSDYANGNVNLLLFEAYYGIAKEYYSAGLYQDAQKNLEQAEFLAWDDQENLMKLFQVQVFLGHTIGKLADYKNAVSYYKYALGTIQASERLSNYPDIAKKFNDAAIWVSYGNYRDAYKAYQNGLADIDVIFSLSDIEIKDGACVAFFASQNFSTLDAVLKVNDLPEKMTVTYGRILKVPTINK